MRDCTCTSTRWCDQCRSLAERAGLILAGAQPPTVAQPLSEAVLQAAVIAVAKTAGYLVYFTKDSRRSPSGFPDLVCAKAGAPLILAELKTDVGACTKAQEAWLTALAASTGVVSAVWRPHMWQEIVERLRG
jgi:hypothetical protein